MYDYQAIAALAAVVHTGSFDKAAQQLGVTASAISQRIKLLEERMGSVLVVRAQPCYPTPTGKRLVQHAEQVARIVRVRQHVQPLDAAGGAGPVMDPAQGAEILDGEADAVEKGDLGRIPAPLGLAAQHLPDLGHLVVGGELLDLALVCVPLLNDPRRCGPPMNGGIGAPASSSSDSTGPVPGLGLEGILTLV